MGEIFFFQFFFAESSLVTWSCHLLDAALKLMHRKFLNPLSGSALTLDVSILVAQMLVHF